MQISWRMMVLLLLLAFGCCFAFVPETKAQVTYAHTDMVYYEPTNSLLIWAETRGDYSTRDYYAVAVEADIYKNGEYVRLIGNGDNGLGESYIETMFPYEPDAEYTVESRHYIEVRHTRSEIYAEGYADYYNYVDYTYGDPVYYPFYYDFFGPGPDRTISFSSILLGITNALFSGGAKAGPPHHLKVITDRTIVRNDLCGQANKLIDFQLVDANNRGVARVNISEEPQNNLVDSCSGINVLLQWCSSSGINPNGTFTDSLKTGCPPSGTPPNSCGFAWGNRWRWCDPAVPNFVINLAWMYYDVRRADIKVDNQSDITDGTYKYP